LSFVELHLPHRSSRRGVFTLEPFWGPFFLNCHLEVFCIGGPGFDHSLALEEEDIVLWAFLPASSFSLSVFSLLPLLVVLA
jgi:hypothetical protein